MLKRLSLVIPGIAFLCIILFQCSKEEKNPYRNIEDPGATYVGMQTCRSCHWQVYETYIQTGMGQSWDIARKQKSAANFDSSHALVYDSIKDLWYKPYWDGDSLAIKEYRLLNGDTTHTRIEKVSYIVGSGQHTNSHIININGYLHQAPITFYTQKGKWDLAPGFENGMNSRFDRKIEMECISCHNGYPELIDGSVNKYAHVKTGIDCERCHGPGSLHVAEKQRGEIVDTSKGPDYSIVNPRRLNTEQQNNLCQRCHLQGIAVLNDDRSFSDFLPSQKLSSVMNVFMPSYSGSQGHMIMASHVERMKMSDCFVNSGKMSCITCHNPHVSVKVTPRKQYLDACASCHSQAKHPCTESQVLRMNQQDNCITCHMPKNGSIDIPHVAVTDHFIRRRPLPGNSEEVIRFIGMKSYNNDKVDARTHAKAYLEFFERYEPNKALLDSAFHYLKMAGVNEKDADPDLLRTFFLKEDYDAIVHRTAKLEVKEIKDAWTSYRIGESFLKKKDHKKAISFLKHAVELKPLALDFRQKLATAYLEDRNTEEARRNFQFILSENPRYAAANGMLGFIYMQEQNFPLAKIYLTRSVMLDPDHVQTLINLAVLYYQLNEKQFIRPLLFHVLKLDPTNSQVQAMLRDLGS